jgi:TatA/E family protein of Tat protein translocase
MDIGPTDLIIILVIVLLVFGPGCISKLGHELGTGIRHSCHHPSWLLVPDAGIQRSRRAGPGAKQQRGLHDAQW